MAFSWYSTPFQTCLRIFFAIIILHESIGVPNITDIIKTRQISPKLSNVEENVSNRRFSLNSTSDINDTENYTLHDLIDVPIDSERLTTRQNSPNLFNKEMKANNRRLSLGVASNTNEDLQRILLDLNMWFPCGKIDRCRVGRNYCNVDTNRCEICNSDVCHGSNADSMCNFMCKEIPTPSPVESSTSSSSATSSPVTITTEGCPTAAPSKVTTKDCSWTLEAVLIAVIVILVLTFAAGFVFVKKYYVRKNSADISTADQETSVMTPVPATTVQGNIIMMRQESNPNDRLAVSNLTGY